MTRHDDLIQIDWGNLWEHLPHPEKKLKLTDLQTHEEVLAEEAQHTRRSQPTLTTTIVFATGVLVGALIGSSATLRYLNSQWPFPPDPEDG